eukprot:snap_masked-scaffold_13-processed-gene-7.35-mRNA-1 protein AED:1.00 eAED:1.00 QI:0/0/0/0/1/1/2/0/427
MKQRLKGREMQKHCAGFQSVFTLLLALLLVIISLNKALNQYSRNSYQFISLNAFDKVQDQHGELPEVVRRKRKTHSAIGFAKIGNSASFFDKKSLAFSFQDFNTHRFANVNQLQRLISAKLQSYTGETIVCVSKIHCISDLTYSLLSEKNIQINQFLGSTKIWANKAGFCESMQKTRNIENISFACWTRKTYESFNFIRSDKYIIKPSRKSGGRGIEIKDGAQVKSYLSSLKSEFVAQTLLENPFLINDFKFDFRVHVLVESLWPFKVWMHRDGLVRLASRKYDLLSVEAYLTNLSVKKSTKDTTKLVWSLDELLNYIEKSGVLQREEMWNRVGRSVRQTLIGTLNSFKLLYQSKGLDDFRCPTCYQILGFDLILDAELWPHVMEINTNPTMNFKSEKIDEGCKRFQRDVGRILFSEDNVSSFSFLT